jgi:hypothetical protein
LLKAITDDRNNLSMIAFFDLRSDFRFIECIAALGKLFFAVSGLSDCHGVDLATTGWLYFSLDDRSTDSQKRPIGVIGVGRSIEVPQI